MPVDLNCRLGTIFVKLNFITRGRMAGVYFR